MKTTDLAARTDLLDLELDLAAPRETCGGFGPVCLGAVAVLKGYLTAEAAGQVGSAIATGELHSLTLLLRRGAIRLFQKFSETSAVPGLQRAATQTHSSTNIGGFANPYYGAMR